jgi:hypothetical protein
MRYILYFTDQIIEVFLEIREGLINWYGGGIFQDKLEQDISRLAKCKRVDTLQLAPNEGCISLCSLDSGMFA